MVKYKQPGHEYDAQPEQAPELVSVLSAVVFALEIVDGADAVELPIVPWVTMCRAGARCFSCTNRALRERKAN